MMSTQRSLSRDWRDQSDRRGAKKSAPAFCRYLQHSEDHVGLSGTPSEIRIRAIKTVRLVFVLIAKYFAQQTYTF